MTNWEACLNALLTAPVIAWRGGPRETVQQCIDDLRARRNGFTPTQAKRELARTGLGLQLPGAVADRASGFVLAVPNASPLVAALFEGTGWAAADGVSGLWKDALRQAPGQIVITDKHINRICINGVQQRCSLVVLTNFRRSCAENARLESPRARPRPFGFLKEDRGLVRRIQAND